jgi:S-ribosylhomocysteine lyase LuxS involved in autoinducer biosynthesis
MNSILAVVCAIVVIGVPTLIWLSWSGRLYQKHIVDTWKDKLEAFCTGLEMENIPELLAKATAEDFKHIGEVMSNEIKKSTYRYR